MAKFFEEERPVQPDGIENLENDFTAGVDEVAQGFRDRMATEEKRFVDVCDSNYYFVVCFSNAEQKNEFCEQIGIDPDERFISGREMAKAYRKTLASPDTSFPKVQSFNKDYLSIARKLK